MESELSFLSESVTLSEHQSREEWLEHRTSYIGGSDAGSILGLNRWKTNLDLWAEKTGRQKPADISDNPAVIFGIEAEPHIRVLSALHYQQQHPELSVWYRENNIFTNTKYPWAHASLDGIFYWPDGWAIFEAKTVTVSNSQIASEWRDQVKPSYYAQCLHYMMVMEAPAVYLSALLRYPDGDKEELRHYRILREEVEGDIEILKEHEQTFMEYIEARTPPALILPDI